MNQDEEGEKVMAAMANPLDLSFNHITLVNNVKGNSKTSNPHASLIHLEMKIKEKCVMAIVDTGILIHLLMLIVLQNWGLS